MPVHAVLLHALALVLALAGVRKVIDPAPVAASLRRSGLPSAPVLGRLLGVVEVVVSLAVLSTGGAVPAALMGLVYLGFLAFILSNKLRGADVPCGCFGESTTPPGVAHIAVNTVAVAAAVAGVLDPSDGVFGWIDEGAVGVVALALVVVAGALTIALLEVLPGTASSALEQADRARVPTFSLKEPR
ncbi:MauE/DoxX family redox-associated membrane protein [Actinomarinicola tropica]|uniref:Methylamine utilisation protein MauE domain-containing protein n=1 Tax=Actinomarinicola tropica TaxID=2789776 RepID=A0A5Q2RQE6_9ACTN|nr:MauE/DoxX family redox-associated membrane protein [Actinomarinicola tropica]QGG96666.1 hypothetical protein GH723_17045 [Actinomarinicola tropica]